MLCAIFQRNLTAHLKDSFPSGKSRVVEKDILYTELAYGSLPELAQYCGLNSRDHPVEVIRARLEGGGRRPEQMEEGRLLLEIETFCCTSCYLFWFGLPWKKKV